MTPQDEKKNKIKKANVQACKSVPQFPLVFLLLQIESHNISKSHYNLCIVKHILPIFPQPHGGDAASGIKCRTSSAVKVHNVINIPRRKCGEHSGEGHTVNEYLVRIRRSGHSVYQAIGKNRLMYPSQPSSCRCCTVTQESATAFRNADCRASL